MPNFEFYCNVRFNLFRIGNRYHEFANVSNRQNTKLGQCCLLHQNYRCSCTYSQSPIRKTEIGMCKTTPKAKLLVYSLTVVTYLCFVIVSHSNGVHLRLHFGQMKSHYWAKWAPLRWIDSECKWILKWWLNTELPRLIKISCERACMALPCECRNSIW